MNLESGHGRYLVYPHPNRRLCLCVRVSLDENGQPRGYQGIRELLSRYMKMTQRFSLPPEESPSKSTKGFFKMFKMASHVILVEDTIYNSQFEFDFR